MADEEKPTKPDEEKPTKPGPLGSFSDGKMCDSDEGDLAIAIAKDPNSGNVVIDFGKPVNWIGMSPQDAITFAAKLFNIAKN